MKITIREIYLVFLKVGIILLGGGYVILPLLSKELVEKRNWITKEDLVEFYSISQCLPGIIAANTAVFTGYKLKGKYGAAAAVAGMCTSPFLAIVCLATVLGQLTKVPLVVDIFWGVGIGILILLLLTVQEIWETSIVDKFTLFLFLIVFALTVFCTFSPVYSIIGAAFAGIIYKLIKRRVE